MWVLSMKTCVYFAESMELSSGPTHLALGYGFHPTGLWRNLPLPAGAAGLVVDDRFAPDRRGAAAARQALSAWEGLVIFDFERPRQPLLAELITALAGREVVLPPAWAGLPHGAVLIGPWRGGGSFANWLQAQRRRYGRVVLDGAPLRHRAVPGRSWTPWSGSLPARGFSCPGPGCLHCRRSDGSVLFWDTRQTLMARLEAADVPSIVFRSDWDVLEEEEADAIP